jgi:hypothetical protein
MASQEEHRDRALRHKLQNQTVRRERSKKLRTEGEEQRMEITERTRDILDRDWRPSDR